jgi:ABC-type multidrug transport system ATPase subunit
MLGITKTWAPRTVLDGVDLELAHGTATAIVGRNGVGKTTLLRIAGGLIAPDSGSVSMMGLAPIGPTRREFARRLGYLSAGDRGLYARFPVRRQLDLWARLALLPGRRRAELVNRAIERFELMEFAASRVDRISMGQRQRVRIAMAFLHEPLLVLLDEPLTSLDRVASGCVVAATDELRARGGCVLWCAPEPAAPLDFDTVVEIVDGKLRRA